MAQLGGWKRIGIIVSVVWILGVGIYVYDASTRDVNAQVWLQDFECKQAVDKALPKGAVITGWDAQGHPIEIQRRHDSVPLIDPNTGEDVSSEYAACDKQTAVYRANLKDRPLRASILFAFITVPLGWGFVYLILFLVNWVKRGFMRPGNSN